MPGNPLLFVVAGLAFILAPAALVSVSDIDEAEETTPSEVVTNGRAQDECLNNSLLMPQGGRIGCTSMKKPLRRTDSTGALFVTVGE
ncbi:MAG: hypothetical protein AAGA47_10085 [Pseudomonadota bacterium]